MKKERLLKGKFEFSLWNHFW